MLKKSVKAIAVLSLLLILTVSPVSAAVNPGSGADTMALYYRSASASLEVEKDGMASLKGNINGISGITTKTTVHLYLQRYKDGVWEDVDDWLSTGETVNRSLTKTKQVTKGYKYRAKASCYAYSGTKYEHVTKYSDTVSY